MNLEAPGSDRRLHHSSLGGKTYGAICEAEAEPMASDDLIFSTNRLLLGGALGAVGAAFDVTGSTLGFVGSKLKSATVGDKYKPPEEIPPLDAKSHIWCIVHDKIGRVYAGDTTGVLHAWRADSSVGGKDANKPRMSDFSVKAHRGPIYTLCVHDGLLFSGGADGAVRAWRLVGDEISDPLNEQRLVGQSVIGQWLCLWNPAAAVSIGAEESLLLLQLPPFSCSLVCSPFRAAADSLPPITCLATADARTLFAGGADGRVHRWSITAGELSAPVSSERASEIRAIALIAAPNSSTLVVVASVGNDAITRLWHPKTLEFVSSVLHATPLRPGPAGWERDAYEPRAVRHGVER